MRLQRKWAVVTPTCFDSHQHVLSIHFAEKKRKQKRSKNLSVDEESIKGYFAITNFDKRFNSSYDMNHSQVKISKPALPDW